MASFFDAKGVQLQEEAETAREAEKRFAYSCRRCGEMGRNVACDSCPIAEAHEVCMDVFAFLAREREAKARAAQVRNPALNPVVVIVL